ncbi:MAG TPA: TonB-dependent receptor [Steroidobacteraceae bacterium]|nr:TonB-dependent receptor [Steroidobacteraceae bacterium]
MIKRTPLAYAIRLAIGGAAGLSAALAAPAVLAQGDEEGVVVIGSRIARSADFEGPSPILTVDREAIENSGYQNLQQLLEKIPVNGNGAFSTRGNNQDSTANGAASISLRGLGADATLVLVNGRRVAISSFAESVTTNFVDINTIPVAAIERVEVLKDGASAVYGSDAVAGVINIVLRKDFDGFEVTAGYGDVTSGSSSETTASAIWGTSGDDSNVTMIFDYFKNSTLFNFERGRIGSADNSAFGGADFRSSRGYPGRFFVDDGMGGTTILRDPACPVGSIAGQTCLYDYGPWNLLVPEAERTGMLLLGRKGMGAGIELFTEIAVQHNTSIAQGAPTPLDETAGLTLNNHPDDPFGGDATGISRYRTVDAGARQWDIETDNLRAVVGLRGEFNDWRWEVGAQRARSESTQTGDKTQGWVRTDFLQQQLDLGLYNPFGGVQNPASVIDAITTNLVRQGKSNLSLYDATITGPLFEMGAGQVMMAAGLEYRDERITDVPDDQFQRGLIFGTESVSAAAQRDNWSAFVEFSFPLLETLELQVAGRYDDYSDFGDTTNPKVALRWAPMDSFALRASWGEGFRAPSLAQIGLGPSQESEFFQDTFGCADNPVYCANTDFQINFSGNPDLQPEESETFNIGAVWQPTGATSVSLDFWDIQQDNKIDEVPRIFIYNQECNNQASTVCVRGAPLPGDTLGPLQFIRSSFRNIGSQSAQGVDLAVYHNMGLGDGSLTLGLDWTHLLEFDKVLLGSDGLTFETQEFAGEYEYPEDRIALTGDYRLGDWAVGTRVNYISSFNDWRDLSPSALAPVGSVDSFTTVNFQFAYTGFENTKISLFLDNAFDEEVPVCVCDGDTDVYGFVSAIHNPRGRFWSLRTTYSFR